jgi:hypothetical protein
VNSRRGGSNLVLPCSALGSHVVPVDPMFVCKTLLLGMFRCFPPHFQELSRLK